MTSSVALMMATLAVVKVASLRSLPHNRPIEIKLHVQKFGNMQSKLAVIGTVGIAIILAVEDASD